MTVRPRHDEAAEYYFTYIDQVADGDISLQLAAQALEVRALLQAILETRSLHRYAEGAWSIRDVVSHVSDVERLVQARAFWFARGFDTPLPSFDQHVAVAAACAADRAWVELQAEFQTVRSSSIAFFRALPPNAWERRGVASDSPFTVRALAYIAVGHVAHHMRALRERYLAV